MTGIKIYKISPFHYCFHTGRPVYEISIDYDEDTINRYVDMKMYKRGDETIILFCPHGGVTEGEVAHRISSVAFKDINPTYVKVPFLTNRDRIVKVDEKFF